MHVLRRNGSFLISTETQVELYLDNCGVIITAWPGLRLAVDYGGLVTETRVDLYLVDYNCGDPACGGLWRPSHGDPS